MTDTTFTTASDQPASVQAADLAQVIEFIRKIQVGEMQRRNERPDKIHVSESGRDWLKDKFKVHDAGAVDLVDKFKTEILGIPVILNHLMPKDRAIVTNCFGQVIGIIHLEENHASE